MDAQEAIDWIHQQLKFGIKPGLERMNWMLERLGHPEKDLKCVHVAGTNGKGSTVTYMKELLNSHGYKVGTFTSPYVIRFEERMSIDGEPIPPEILANYVERLKPICEELALTEHGPATEFEIITVIAFLYFKEAKVDYAVIEVGLGGRHDSTNVIKPLISVITTIGLDHMHILGNTLEEIASEKAGIIKKDIPVVSSVVNQPAEAVIREEAEELGAPYYLLNKDFTYKHQAIVEEGELFSFHSNGKEIDQLKIHMPGMHQVQNASLALYAFLLLAKRVGITVETDKIRNALESTHWPGRFEIISKKPKIIIDGAHNQAAFDQLIKTIEKRYDLNQISVLMTSLKQKNIKQFVEIAENTFRSLYLSPFDFPSSYGYNELYQIFENKSVNVIKDWKSFIKDFQYSEDDDSILLVTGSLYFVSQVRAYILENS